MSETSARGETADRAPAGFTLFDLLGILWRRKWIIFGITLAAIVGVLAYAIGSLLLPPERSYLPNVYTSRAVILISEPGVGELSAALAASEAALTGLDLRGVSNGELARLIAKSRTSLDELNAAFDFTSRYRVTQSVKTDTRQAILNHLGVALDERTSTLSIAFTDKDPVFAAEVVNKLVEILDSRFTSIGGSKVRRKMELLEKKIADVQIEIVALQGKIQSFTDRHGVLDVEALATEQITVMARLRSELILKDMEIENYAKFSTIEDPVIKRLRNERESIARKIAELETGSGGGVLPSQRQLPALAFEYAGYQRDLAVQTGISRILTQQYEIAKISAEGQEPVFQVLELAEAPDKKSGPSRAAICVVVTLAAFFLSVLLSLLLHALQRTWKDPDVRRRFRGT